MNKLITVAIALAISSPALACIKPELGLVDTYCGVNILEGFVNQVCLADVSGTDKKVVKLTYTESYDGAKLQSEALIIVKTEDAETPSHYREKKLTVATGLVAQKEKGEFLDVKIIRRRDDIRTNTIHLSGPRFQAELKAVPQSRAVNCGR